MFIKWKKTSEGDNSQERTWWWRQNMTRGSNKHCGGDIGTLWNIGTLDDCGGDILFKGGRC